MADKKYNAQGGSKGINDIYLLADDVPVQSNGSTAATSRSHVAITLEGMISESDIQFNDDGTVNIVPTNYQDDPALQDFINLTKEGSDGNLPEVVLDNGLKLEGNSTGKQYLWIWYGGDITESGTTSTKMLVAKGTFSKKTGSFKTKRGEWTNVVIEFNGAIVTATAGLEIPVGLFETTTLLDVTDATAKLLTIAKDKSYVMDYVKAYGE